jgi:hypothetical protein
MLSRLTDYTTTRTRAADIARSTMNRSRLVTNVTSKLSFKCEQQREEV